MSRREQTRGRLVCADRCSGSREILADWNGQRTEVAVSGVADDDRELRSAWENADLSCVSETVFQGLFIGQWGQGYSERFVQALNNLAALV